MSYIFFALLAPFIWAIINLIDDNLVRHVYKGAHAGAIFSGIFGLVPFGLILAYKDVSLDGMAPNLILLALASGLATVVFYYFYFRALEVEHPSVVIALFSVAPAIVPFAAYFLVGERLPLNAIIGFSIVILAAFTYSLTDIKKFKISKALLPVIAAALIFDGTSIANKYLYNQAEFYQVFLYFSLGMFLGGLYFFYVSVFSNNTSQLKKIVKKNSGLLLLILAAVEGLNILAEFVRNMAINLGPVSIVKALENTQTIWILVISLLLYPLFPKFFPEAKAPRMKLKFLLSAVMIFGVYLAVQ